MFQFEVLVLVRSLDFDLSANKLVVPCCELTEMVAARLQRSGEESPTCS